MDFRILGPLEVWEHGRAAPLGGPKQRALLATLLLDANHVVPADRLVEELWGDDPPATAENLLQGYVSQLRRRLRPLQALVTRPPGYLLQVEQGRLDVHRFEQLMEEARLAMEEGAAERAADALGEALGLWRGPALGDVVLRGLCRSQVAQLEERRMAALEERVEADLRRGRHADVTSELQALVVANPLRERLRAQLMFALYRSGRQAEALAVYRHGRQLLTEELGLEPGPALQRLEHAILAADPALEPPEPTTVADGSPSVVANPPCHLPADLADFTGRQQALAALTGLLGREPDGRAPAMVVAAIAGMAGVGKTALAVHAAHRLRPRFPDGQLYVHLGGPGKQARQPAEVLASLLQALGEEPAAIPGGVEERAWRYRALLADRRVLVVLDDAAAEAQVRVLLPGGAACAALVTSRVTLAGLEAAHQLALDVLDPDEAVALLAKVAGPGRVAAEPVAAEAIARRCGHLPLAVRVAGAKLAARPHWRLARMAERLGDEARRLDELRAGDLEVRAGFAASLRGQSAAIRRVYRLLGLLPAGDFTACAVAVLLDVPVGDAEELLDRLVEVHLVGVAGQDPGGLTRYRLHELLRGFARERLLAETTAADRKLVLDRSGADLQQVATA
jgi:DNA-binding SARP family transcriptional activator